MCYVAFTMEKNKKEQCTFTVRVVKSKSDGGDETCKARKRL